MVFFDLAVTRLRAVDKVPITDHLCILGLFVALEAFHSEFVILPHSQRITFLYFYSGFAFENVDCDI